MHLRKEKKKCSIFATESEAKGPKADTKHNYLHEGWNAEMYANKKQT